MSCTACEDDGGGTNYYKVKDADECATACGSGFFEQTSTFTCEPCHEACLTCDTSATDCLTCGNVTGIVYYFLSNVCYQTCPDLYYGDSSDNTCKSCHANCSKCFAADNTSCTECIANHFLLYGTTECSATCPDGFYSNTTSKKCHLCDSTCATCDTNPDNCTSCLMTAGASVHL